MMMLRPRICLAVALLLVRLLPLTCEEVSSGASTSGSRPEIAAHRIRAPEVVQPGDPVVVSVMDAPDVDGARIRSAGGEMVAGAPAFSVTLTPTVSVRCVVLGLDTTVRAGEYTLEILSGGVPVADRGLVIRSREFRHEEIALTDSLTELRAGDDPRKVTEALELQAITAEFNPDAVYNPGTYRWPIELTRRTSLFGDRRTYLYSDGQRARTVHTGVDLASPEGTPVGASGAGIVRVARSRIVTGNSVVIEHLPGVFSFYYHLDTLMVVEGQIVTAGDQIGTVGATGLATGPHLHWEFRINGVSVDPERMLNAALVDFGP